MNTQHPKGSALILALAVVSLAASVVGLLQVQLKANVRYTDRMINRDHCLNEQYNAKQLHQPIPQCDG